MRAITFGCNLLIVATYGWLLRAYWPPPKPPSPWYMILATTWLGAVWLLLVGVGHELDVLATDTYSAVWPVNVARMLIALGGCYAMGWHLRKGEPKKDAA